MEFISTNNAISFRLVRVIREKYYCTSLGLLRFFSFIFNYGFFLIHYLTDSGNKDLVIQWLRQYNGLLFYIQAKSIARKKILFDTEI